MKHMRKQPLAAIKLNTTLSRELWLAPYTTVAGHHTATQMCARFLLSAWSLNQSPRHQ